jgi:hypothetical protein
MSDHFRLFDHEKFDELAALAHSGTLTACEWSELTSHLKVCRGCQEAYHQYLILAREGMPLLAARYSGPAEQGLQQDIPAPTKLLGRVRAIERGASLDAPGHVMQRIPAHPLVLAAVAACLTIVVGMVSFHLGSRMQSQVRVPRASASEGLQNLPAVKKQVVDELIDSNSEKFGQLRRESALHEQELTTLRAAMRALTDKARELAASKSATEEEFQSILRQRDALNSRLQDTEQAYLSTQAELSSVRTDLNKALLQATSDQTKIDELSSVKLNYERRLQNDEQYLASDRDIRELMGARKLYIADVFDVDSRSHTQKRFGRVFYTQGKSLVFYAFDLDRQPDLKDGSTFQAWGRRDADSKEPLNLGVFYIDSESSRRWALRFDDPKQLAEIDSVFVTAEPHGGSQKPTGKPFLYALLRGEANHP